MTAYVPHEPGIILGLLGLGAGIWLLGVLLHSRPASPRQVWFAWAIAIISVIGVEFLVRAEPAGVRMVTLILALLWSMKLVVIAAFRLDGGPGLAPLRWGCFLFGWPGMQPALFTKPLRPNLQHARQFARRGLLRVACGIGLILLARALVPSRAELPYGSPAAAAATTALLVGVSLVLHFGMFNCLAAGWQAVGWNCQPLFRAPLASTSLAEFWSRRWNLAFSEMTAIVVFRPCRRRLGDAGALFAGFAFSGVLHELAITVPVKSPWGGPLGYFVLHGILVLLERRFDLPRHCGRWYRAAIVLSLVAPLPILFPPAFLREIVWPLAGVSG